MLSKLAKTVNSLLSKDNSDSTVTIEKPSELKIALDNRTFEIQMFWQRSNYFLVLITAIGVAVFSLKDTLLATILSSFGATSSFFWYKTNLGSKFWHESWEVEVIKLAKLENIASFERSTKDIINQVQLSLEESWSGGKKSKLQIYLDRKILEKPSVSYYMILLSIVSTVVWILVTIVLTVDLVIPLISNAYPNSPIVDILSKVLRYLIYGQS